MMLNYTINKVLN